MHHVNNCEKMLLSPLHRNQEEGLMSLTTKNKKGHSYGILFGWLWWQPNFKVSNLKYQVHK